MDSLPFLLLHKQVSSNSAQFGSSNWVSVAKWVLTRSGHYPGEVGSLWAPPGDWLDLDLSPREGTFLTWHTGRGRSAFSKAVSFLPLVSPHLSPPSAVLHPTWGLLWKCDFFLSPCLLLPLCHEVVTYNILSYSCWNTCHWEQQENITFVKMRHGI